MPDTRPALRAPRRLDIQGLRAIAVLAVIAYHVRPSWLPGGFVGVDVFFVISGFLITGALVRELDSNGRIRLRRFWGRRVRRLMPAATLVILVTLLVAYLVMPPTAWAGLAAQGIAASVSVQNWALLANSVNYLHASELPSPLQHFWSLSVEEQYYLVLPLVLIAAAWFAVRTGGRSRTWLLGAVSVIAVASFVFGVVQSRVQPDVAYLSTATRAWELLIGSMLAIVLPGLRIGPRTAGALALTGAVALVASLWLITGTMPFPGIVALVPTIATAALIASGAANETRVGRVLGSRPLTFVGDISYSAYLWHWPLVVFAISLTGSAALPLWVVAMILAATGVLAVLSKRHVEDRFLHPSPPVEPQRRRDRFRRSSLALGSALVLSTVLAGSALQFGLVRAEAAQADFDAVAYPGARLLDPDFHASNVPDGPVPPRPTSLSLQKIERQLTPECMSIVADSSITTCSGGDPEGDRTVALVGDSHAAEWLPALDEIGAREGWRIVVIAKQSCPLTTLGQADDGYVDGDPVYPACEAWNDRVTPFLRELAPSLIVTSAAEYSTRHDFAPGDPVFEQIAAQAHTEAFMSIATPETPVVAIVETPTFPGHSIPECLETPGRTVAECAESMDRSRSHAPSRLRVAAELAGSVGLIDVNPLICPPSGCRPVSGNVVVYRDDNHLTPQFVESLTWFIEQQLRTQHPSLFDRGSGPAG
ncbi:acyltransferase family protein [Agromyces sp. LHK192]|uniref:acyltransferase family protein n=1 Tax=Agromyces sp. LHK192 TaxID=2498704 RepID=UPI0013E36B93|nr:acyltransferase family protein [Agromyces sp. LHK192]